MTPPPNMIRVTQNKLFKPYFSDVDIMEEQEKF